MLGQKHSHATGAGRERHKRPMGERDARATALAGALQGVRL